MKKQQNHINGYTLKWRVRELMDQAHIPTVVELHERLKAVDPDSVNFTRLAQIVDAMPSRLTGRTLLGLAIVFNCTIGDIVCVIRAASDNPQ